MESNTSGNEIDLLWKMYYSAEPFSENEMNSLEYDGGFDSNRFAAGFAQGKLIKLGLLDPHAEWPAERKDKND